MINNNFKVLYNVKNKNMCISIFKVIVKKFYETTRYLPYKRENFLSKISSIKQ